MKSHLLVFFHDFLCFRILECSFGFQFVNKSGLKLTQRLLLHGNLRHLFINKKDEKKNSAALIYSGASTRERASGPPWIKPFGKPIEARKSERPTSRRESPGHTPEIGRPRLAALVKIKFNVSLHPCYGQLTADKTRYLLT